MNSITLGSDPEMMLFDNNEGKMVSSLRVFKGRDKHRPINLGDGIKMYPDNVLIESAFPPAPSIADMMVMLKTVLVRMAEQLKGRYSLVAQSSHVYDKSELRGKKPWEIGCNPNHDCYSEGLNPTANMATGLRTGSFHLHLGHPMLNTIHEKRAAIKLLDIFVGCSSVLFDKDETSPARRKLYGRAGEFRPTPYGVEYRVLGNWALRSPQATELVWDLVAHAASHIDHRTIGDVLKSVGPIHPQLAINDNDKIMAFRVLDKAGLPATLLNRVTRNYESPELYKAWGI